MTDPDSLFSSGMSCLKEGGNEDAARFFLTALSGYRAMKRTEQSLAQICRSLYLAAEALVKLGMNAEAESFLKDALRVSVEVSDPEIKAGAYFGFGEFLVVQDRFSDAIPFLQTALKLNDYPSNRWRLLGIAFDKTGKPEEALRCFEQGLKVDPLDPQLLYDTAVCLGYLRRFEESDELFDQAIALAPAIAVKFKAQTHNAQGGMLKRAGLLGKAEMSFRKAIELDPQHDGAPYNLAQLLELLGREKEALRYWQTAAELDPSDISATNNLRRLRAKLGQ